MTVLRNITVLAAGPQVNAVVSAEKRMRRIVAVLMVGILLGIGSAVWQYCSTSTDSGVTPGLRVAGAAEEKESTGEEKIEWGEETRGQVANLRVLSTEVKSGEPIEFEILVKNVSDRDVHLPSGRADEKMSPCFWTFYFDQWEWRSPQLACRNVPLKPGETVSVRCLVATTRESVTAEQESRFLFHAPFRHMKSKNESDRLPAGSYRVRAINGTLDNGVKSNTIEVRIIDRR